MTSRRTSANPAYAAKIHTYTTGTIDQSRSTQELSCVIRDEIQQNAQTTAATMSTRRSGAMRGILSARNPAPRTPLAPG